MYARTDLPPLRSPFSATLAMSVAGALLLAFGLVVDQGIQQATLRHIEADAQAEAVWRCAVSKGNSARIDCEESFRMERVASRTRLP
ncbi:MAG: hypothetical protein Q8N44_16970 [Rubrivivax sp.]|nr:hypothetical protein [Rubrivivax sp.]MDP3085363.1 hypothetical protein [Rubrivivax sp.]